MKKAILIPPACVCVIFYFAAIALTACSEPKYDVLLVKTCREILEEVAVNPSHMKIVRFYFTNINAATERVEFHIDDPNEHGVTVRRTIICSFENDSLASLEIDRHFLPERDTFMLSLRARTHLVSENLVEGRWCQWTGWCAP